ncbi:MAG TPA: restriction endonuclease, partial [Steroidobacter sp.]|nr:restriction endonuclease [Steroidobacter sp.]
MARRRESILEVFFVLPWWASAIAALSSYLLLTYAAPAYFSGNVYTSALGSAAKAFAPLVATVFMATALASWTRSLFIARKFNSQNGIDDIRKLSWRQFESIVGEAFRRRGYSVIESGGGADGGVDLVLRRHGGKFYVQCKQWKAWKVGVKPIRELFGVITAGDAQGGFFVTSGEYTHEAREFATSAAIKL